MGLLNHHVYFYLLIVKCIQKISLQLLRFTLIELNSAENMSLHTLRKSNAAIECKLTIK